MALKKAVEVSEVRGGDVERRFARLLSIMKERYLAAGYELDDVQLAEILDLHDGILRKGKSSSVSPALARAVGKFWEVDLNWLLLGEGEEPGADGPPTGITRLSLDSRIARGRWDEHKVRRFLAGRRLSQKELARLLGTDPQRAGNLVRGTLRDAALRKRLAEILKVAPDSLFLSSRQSFEVNAGAGVWPGRKRLFSLETVRGAVLSLLAGQLEKVLLDQAAGNAPAPAYKTTEVRITIPPPPPELSESERLRYEHNREALERWSRSSAAFEVPPVVASRYCREVVGFYDGGRVDDVGGILRDFMQEDLERSDTRPDTEADSLKLKKSVLLVGGAEIEVDDPELLAKLPEYLGSKLGRKRLLAWLRKNVKHE